MVRSFQNSCDLVNISWFSESYAKLKNPLINTPMFFIFVTALSAARQTLHSVVQTLVAWYRLWIYRAGCHESPHTWWNQTDTPFHRHIVQQYSHQHDRCHHPTHFARRSLFHQVKSYLRKYYNLSYFVVSSWGIRCNFVVVKFPADAPFEIAANNRHMEIYQNQNRWVFVIPIRVVTILSLCIHNMYTSLYGLLKDRG